MRTEALFELKRGLPNLSDGAMWLLAFIYFRIDGSKFVDDDGVKYITLTGNNDPAEALSMSNSKIKRLKKELRDAGILIYVRSGFAQPYRTYLNLPLGSNMSSLRNETSQNSTVSKTAHHRAQICTSIGSKSEPSASYIRKTNIKTNRKDQARTASQPSRAPTTGEILQQMLEEELAKEAEAKRKEKKDVKSGGFTADDLPTEIL